MVCLSAVDSDGLGPDTEVDQVPAGADPNSELQSYVNAALPQADIAPRAATFAPYPGTKQAGLIKALISTWNIDQLDLGMKQVNSVYFWHHIASVALSHIQLERRSA